MVYVEIAAKPREANDHALGLPSGGAGARLQLGTARQPLMNGGLDAGARLCLGAFYCHAAGDQLALTDDERVQLALVQLLRVASQVVG